jgi:cytochrome c oxidase cbb3-type subunit 1
LKISTPQKNNFPMSAASHQPTTAESGEIDASVRAPVLVLLAFAILWLLAASALGLVAAIKLHTPGFLASCEFLTYGRVYPAALNALAYGWGVNAGLAVSLWLMARLARGTLPSGGLLIVATVFWNVGVKLGVLAILAGYSNSIPWLEMPGYVAPFLLVAYALIAAWVLAVLRRGASPHLYASQWYVLAALFWFPWLYSAAQLMVVFRPVRGTVQSVVAAWFAQGFLGLWFAALGLGLIYYFIPTVLGKPVRGYAFAAVAFWSFALLTCWTGAARLTGAPVPAWTQAAGRAASFLLLLPLVIIAVNFFVTLGGSLGALRQSVVLRFTAVAAVFFALCTLRGVLLALPGWETLRLTWLSAASDYVTIYGVFSMAVFGGVYYLAPRLVGRTWPFAGLIHAHFGLAVIGLVLGVGALSCGGWQQAGELADTKVALGDVTAHTLPYLRVATVGGILLLLGHLAFAFNFIKLVLCPCHRAASAAVPVPVQLLSAPEMEATVP